DPRRVRGGRALPERLRDVRRPDPVRRHPGRAGRARLRTSLGGRRAGPARGAQLGHPDRHLPPPRGPARRGPGGGAHARRRLPPAGPGGPRVTTALPAPAWLAPTGRAVPWHALVAVAPVLRSEEHTSELQS